MLTLRYNIKFFIKSIRNNSLIESLFLAIPLLLISGPFLPDLSLIIIVIIGLFKFRRKLFNVIIEQKIIVIIIFFSTYNILNSFTSEENIISFKSSIAYLRFPLFAIVASLILNNNKKLFFQSFLLVKMILIVLCIDAFFQFITNFNLLGFEAIQKNRISGMFGDEYVLGSYLVKIFPLYLFLNYYTNKLSFSITKETLFFTLIVFLAIFISGERTSLLLICTMMFLLFMLINNKPFNDYLKYFFYISFISVIIITIFSKDLRERYVYLTVGQILSFNIGNLKQDDIKNQNLLHLKVSYKMFKDKPLNGYGNKMFGHKCFKDYFVDDGRCSTHPNNILAQVLVETGLIGFTLYVLLLFFIIMEIISSKKRSKNAHLILLIAILINFSPTFPSGNFFNNWVNILYYLPISFYIALKNDLFISNHS